MDAKKVGSRIQAARKNAGMTQDTLAQAVGLSTKYISNLECGKKTAKLDTFIQIANTLKIDANSLLADVLDCYTEIEASELSRKLKGLPISEQKKALRILDVIIGD